jgi:hypothetical protein
MLGDLVNQRALVLDHRAVVGLDLLAAGVVAGAFVLGMLVGIWVHAVHWAS